MNDHIDQFSPRSKRLLLFGAVFNRRAHSLAFWNATQRCHVWLRAFNWRSGIARSRARSSLRRSGSSVRSTSAASYCVTAWRLSTPQHHRPTPSQPVAARDAARACPCRPGRAGLGQALPERAHHRCESAGVLSTEQSDHRRAGHLASRDAIAKLNRQGAIAPPRLDGHRMPTYEIEEASEVRPRQFGGA
jgi:hypothetical protein